MYTELAVNVQFKPDTPVEVLDLLEKIASSSDVTIDQVPAAHRSHPFFATTRWSWCIRSGGSAYFDGGCFREFRCADELDAAVLMVWTNIKNYDNEWQLFLDWFTPYNSSKGYIGHMRYEESDRPTLLYMRGGTIVTERPNRDCDDPPVFVASSLGEWP